MIGNPYGNSNFGKLGAHMPKPLRSTEEMSFNTYGLSGMDGPAGVSLPAKGFSGLGGVGDMVTQTVSFLFSSTGLLLGLGVLAIVGYQKGWFEE